MRISDIENRLHSVFGSIGDRIDDRIERTAIGRAFDRGTSMVYRVTGIDFLVDRLDQTGYFDSRQYGSTPERSEHFTKGGYAFASALLADGIITADPFFIMLGVGMYAGALLHHNSRIPRESILTRDLKIPRI